MLLLLLLLAAAVAALAIIALLARPRAPLPEAQPDRLWAELTMYLNWLSVTALLACAALFARDVARIMAAVHGKELPWLQAPATSWWPATRLLVGACVVGVAVLIVLKNFFTTLKHA